MFGPRMRWVWFACGLIGVAAGCGPKVKLPPMEKVSGVVKLDGSPLPRGIVQFRPEAGGPSSTGTIGADGRYELMTAQTKGAPVGKHTVTVEARAVPKDETDTLPALLHPEKYLRHETSGEVKEVVAGKANVIDIELSSK